MVLALLKYGLRREYKPRPDFRYTPELKPSYDVVIVGAGGHGLATAYYLKEELRQFYRQTSLDKAAALLDDWYVRADASGVFVLQKMAQTLRRHRDGILNFYRFPISTGPLEGFNNKAQTMKRQAYGYRNIEFYKLKLMTLHEKKYSLTG